MSYCTICTNCIASYTSREIGTIFLRSQSSERNFNGYKHWLLASGQCGSRDLATVNALLKHSVSICQRFQLPKIVLVFDEALNARTQTLRWKNEEYRNRLVIRLPGDFHTIMSFCSAIAKIFKYAYTCTK